MPGKLSCPPYTAAPGWLACRRMQCDIQLAAEQIQAPAKLKAAVVGLRQTHAGGEAGAKARAAASPSAAAAGAAAVADDETQR